jgi:hypothetical protein
LNKDSEILDLKDSSNSSGLKPILQNPAFLVSLFFLTLVILILFRGLLKDGDPFDNFFQERFRISAMGYPLFVSLLMGLVSGFIATIMSKARQWPILLVFALNMAVFLYFLYRAISD